MISPTYPTFHIITIYIACQHRTTLLAYSPSCMYDRVELVNYNTQPTFKIISIQHTQPILPYPLYYSLTECTVHTISTI